MRGAGPQAPGWSSASADGQLSMRNEKSLDVPAEARIEAGRIGSIAVKSPHELLAVGYQDGGLVLLDDDPLETVEALAGHSGAVSAVCVSAKCQQMASSRLDSKVLLRAPAKQARGGSPRAPARATASRRDSDRNGRSRRS